MERILETIAEEIVMVRRLAVFALLNSGVSQEKVAAALGVSQATISRLAAGNGKAKAPRRATTAATRRKRSR
jgi:predicted transcriptional regulator